MFVCFTLFLPIYSSFNNCSYNFSKFGISHVYWLHFIFTCECFFRDVKSGLYSDWTAKMLCSSCLSPTYSLEVTHKCQVKKIQLSSIPPSRLSVKITLEQRHRDRLLHDPIWNTLQSDHEPVLTIMLGTVFQPLGHISFHEIIQTTFLLLIRTVCRAVLKALLKSGFIKFSAFSYAVIQSSCERKKLDWCDLLLTNLC